MIIKFDQTPEEYFRLSRAAYKRGEYDRALLYGEKALRGKASVEHKVSCAEILVAMGRYADAANVALDALCHGRGMRTELYDVLASAASGMGAFYDALHYVAKKAQYEGDDDTLDAMDEVMQELEASEVPQEGPQFFVVGKQEEQKDEEGDYNLVNMANFARLRERYDEALDIASKVQKGTPAYVKARLICLRAYMQMKEHDKALETAVEMIGLEPKNGYVLYVLIDKYKKREYIPLLYGVEDGGKELYYAALAAEHAEEYSVAISLSEKIVEQNPYLPAAYFTAAAIRLNGGDKKESEDYLKRLFAIYGKYPQEVLLKGWRKLKKCEIGPEGSTPAAVVRILENYAKKQLKNTEDLAVAMLTDEAFRKALKLLLIEGDRKFCGEIIRRFEEVSNAQADAFFADVLLSPDVDVALKREIFVCLYLHKNKGGIYAAQSVVPLRVSCVKPYGFEAYPYCVRKAYGEVLSVLIYMTDVDGEARLQTLAERAAKLEDAEDLSWEALCMAFMCRMFSDGVIPVKMWAPSLVDACKFFSEFVFGIKRVNMQRVRLLSEILAD